jgi:hypothetical protein
LEATLTLEYDDAETAQAIAKAVSPDNLEVPAGLSVKTACKGNLVVSEIALEGKMATFIATVDDLLACVSAAEKALHLVKRDKCQ